VVLLQAGAAAPRLQTSFPSPASVSQVKSETSRWGGESKGWGLQFAVYEHMVIFLNIKVFIS